MKPHVLIFSIAYEPFIGGAELAVRQITDRLSQYEFDLITCRLKANLPRQEKIGNVRVFRVGFGTRLGRLLYPALAFRLARRLHREHPFQLVWSIMAAYAGAAALIFLRRFPEVKFLLTLQEGDDISHIHRQVRGFRQTWQEVFKRADRIQAISDFLGRWARKEGATGPIEVIPNGVEMSNFQFPISPPPGDPPQGDNFQTNPKSQIQKIISVSRLVEKNGVDILIKAAKELRTMISDSLPTGDHPQGDKFLIQILGGGSEEGNLKKLARRLEVEDIVEFKGEIRPETVSKFLREADIFVRPSRSEGLGSAFLEAMAAGLPVIGTAVGGIPDFLKDGETGIFCRINDPLDLAKQIRRLLVDEGLRLKLAENGRKLVFGHYSWEKVAQQMDNLFKRLI